MKILTFIISGSQFLNKQAGWYLCFLLFKPEKYVIYDDIYIYHPAILHIIVKHARSFHFFSSSKWSFVLIVLQHTWGQGTPTGEKPNGCFISGGKNRGEMSLTKLIKCHAGDDLNVCSICGRNLEIKIDLRKIWGSRLARNHTNAPFVIANGAKLTSDICRK